MIERNLGVVGQIVTPEARIIGLMIKYNVAAEKVDLKPEHFRDPDLRYLLGFLGGDGRRSVAIEKLRRAAFAGHEFARYGVWLVDAAAADDVDDPVAAIAILAEQIRKPNGDSDAPASYAKKLNGANQRDINDIRIEHGPDAVRDAFDRAVGDEPRHGDKSTSWSVPDVHLIDDDRVPPPPFDWNALPPTWVDWVKNTARDCGAPADYVAATLICVASAVIGNARRVSPWEGWVEQPHLWFALIGQPSTNKTVALAPLSRILSARRMRS